MDGFKGRLNSSIQLRLSFWLCLVILFVAMAAGAFSFSSAFREALLIQDDTLRQLASLVERQHLDAGREVSPVDEHDELQVTVQFLPAGAGPAQLEVAEGLLPVPAALPDGVHTLAVGDDAYRVLIRTIASGERLAVAQDTDLREAVAFNGAVRTILPLLVLVPILLVVVAHLVNAIYHPVAVLAGDINHRKDDDFRPIAEQSVPSEVRPFVSAINRLLGRVARSMESQRRFVADAAHELRSPLTALSLQAERLADVAMPELARQRLDELRQGIERERVLLEQLLAMAKAQQATDMPRVPVSVRQVFKSVLEDLMPLAQARGIDIGVEGDGDAQVLASEIDLAGIVRNLADNAIRYTPRGGRVDLSVTSSAEEVTMQVRDTGPGIPSAERERVFDPFYRGLGTEVLGSGLGLAIVKTIVDRLGARLSLGDANEQPPLGLCVRVQVAAAGGPPDSRHHDRVAVAQVPLR